jgi:hypothetical protein
MVLLKWFAKSGVAANQRLLELFIDKNVRKFGETGFLGRFARVALTR